MLVVLSPSFVTLAPCYMKLSTFFLLNNFPRQAGFTITIHLQHFAFLGIQSTLRISWYSVITPLLHSCLGECSFLMTVGHRVRKVKVFKHSDNVPFLFLPVCCITQSMMRRNKKPVTHYPCSTPVITGKGAVISLSSITEHWKSEIGQYVLIMIIIKTTLHVVAFTQDIYLLH